MATLKEGSAGGCLIKRLVPQALLDDAHGPVILIYAGPLGGLPRELGPLGGNLGLLVPLLTHCG
jgi:hypothetical protein